MIQSEITIDTTEAKRELAEFRKAVEQAMRAVEEATKAAGDGDAGASARKSAEAWGAATREIKGLTTDMRNGFNSLYSEYRKFVASNGEAGISATELRERVERLSDEGVAAVRKLSNEFGDDLPASIRRAVATAENAAGSFKVRSLEVDTGKTILRDRIKQGIGDALLDATPGGYAAREFANIAGLSTSAAVGLGAAAAGAVAVGAGLKIAVDKAIEFETALVGVKKTSGFSTEELDQFREGAVRLAQDTGIAFTEIAKTGETLAAAGISDLAENLKFTEAALDFSRLAGGLNADQIAEVFGQIRNSFQLTGGEARGLAAGLNFVADSVGGTEETLAELVSRAGQGAKILGLTANELAAVGGAILAQGGNVEVASTALNKTFLQIKTDALGVAPALGEFNTKLKELAETSPREAVTQLAEQLGKLDEKARAIAISEIFDTKDQDTIRAWLALANSTTQALGDTGGLRDALEKTGVEVVNQTKYTEALNDVNDSYAAKQAQFNQVLETFAATVGAELLPLLTDFLTVLLDILRPQEEVAGGAKKVESGYNGLKNILNQLALPFRLVYAAFQSMIGIQAQANSAINGTIAKFYELKSSVSSAVSDVVNSIASFTRALSGIPIIGGGLGALANGLNGVARGFGNSAEQAGRAASAFKNLSGQYQSGANTAFGKAGAAGGKILAPVVGGQKSVGVDPQKLFGGEAVTKSIPEVAAAYERFLASIGKTDRILAEREERFDDHIDKIGKMIVERNTELGELQKKKKPTDAEQERIRVLRDELDVLRQLKMAAQERLVKEAPTTEYGRRLQELFQLKQSLQEILDIEKELPKNDLIRSQFEFVRDSLKSGISAIQNEINSGAFNSILIPVKVGDIEGKITAIDEPLRLVSDVVGEATKNTDQWFEALGGVVSLLDGVEGFISVFGEIGNTIREVVKQSANALSSFGDLAKARENIQNSGGFKGGIAQVASLAVPALGIATALGSVVAQFIRNNNERTLAEAKMKADAIQANNELVKALSENAAEITKSINEFTSVARLASNVSGDAINQARNDIAQFRGAQSGAEARQREIGEEIAGLVDRMNETSSEAERESFRIMIQNLEQELGKIRMGETSNFEGLLTKLLGAGVISDQLYNAVKSGLEKGLSFSEIESKFGLLKSIEGVSGKFGGFANNIGGAIEQIKFFADYVGDDAKTNLDRFLMTLVTSTQGMGEQLEGVTPELRKLIATAFVSDPAEQQKAIERINEEIARRIAGGDTGFLGGLSPDDALKLIDTLRGLSSKVVSEDGAGVDGDSKSVRIVNSITEFQAVEVIAQLEQANYYLAQLVDRAQAEVVVSEGGAMTGNEVNYNNPIINIPINVNGLSDSTIEAATIQMRNELRRLQASGLKNGRTF